MLGVRKKSKQKKRSLGFIGGKSGSVSDVDDRVIMLCEDIPSEGSSWDSGQGSHSSGARSSGDELGRGWSSRSFPKGEGQSTSSSSRPTKQYYVRAVRHVESSPAYGQDVGCSTSHTTELYESLPTILLCASCIYLPSIMLNTVRCVGSGHEFETSSWWWRQWCIFLSCTALWKHELLAGMESKCGWLPTLYVYVSFNYISCTFNSIPSIDAQHLPKS